MTIETTFVSGLVLMLACANGAGPLMVAFSKAANPISPTQCDVHAQRAHGRNVRIGPGTEQETAVIPNIETVDNGFGDLYAICRNGCRTPHRPVERR